MDDLGFVPTKKEPSDDLGFIPTKSKSAPTPSNNVDTAISAGKTALSGLGKFLGFPRALTVGPLTGLAMESGTGKSAFSGQDVLNAINPTNLKRFPTNYEMMQNVGKQPGLLSDVVPGYGKPGKSPWYQPEKGGSLDPSSVGLLEAVTDPVTLATLGEAGAAKAALESAAPRAALTAAAETSQGPIGKALTMGGKAFDTLAMPVTAPAGVLARGVRAVPGVGPAIMNLGAAPTKVLGGFGDKLYSSLIGATEDLGRKFGKTDVAKTFYDAGIKTPLGFSGKAADAADTLMNARDAGLSAAGAQGAKVDIDAALKPAEDMVAKWRGIDHPNAQKLADAGDEVIQQYRAKAAGTPAVPGEPARSVMQDSAVLDMQGNPMQTEKVIPGTPGTPAIPGKTMSPAQGSTEKTFASKQVPSSQYTEFANTPEWQRFSKTLAGGFRDEVENSVGRTMGAKAGTDVGDLNAAAGNILSTRRGQLTAENQANRLSNRIVTPTGSDSVMVPFGMAMNGTDGGLTTMAMKHAIDALRMGTMPAGYALKRFAESNIGGPVFNAYLREKLKNMTEEKKK